MVITAMRSEPAYGGFRSTLDLHPLMLVAFVLMAAAATRLASETGLSGLAWSGAATAWIGVALSSVNVMFILTTAMTPQRRHSTPAFFLMAVGIALTRSMGTLPRSRVVSVLAVGVGP